MGSKGLKEFHPTTKAQEKQIPSPGSQLEGGIDDTFMSSLKFSKDQLGQACKWSAWASSHTSFIQSEQVKSGSGY